MEAVAAVTCPRDSDRCTDQTPCTRCPHQLSWRWIVRATIVAALIGCAAAAIVITVGLVALAAVGAL